MLKLFIRKSKPRSAAIVRACLNGHLEIQNCIHSYNSTFAPFLLLFTINIFSMAICMISSLLKVNLDTANYIVYSGNSFQYLLRAFIALYSFGRVQGNHLSSTLQRLCFIAANRFSLWSRYQVVTRNSAEGSG